MTSEARPRPGLGRPADLRRGRQPRPDRGRHPRGAARRRRCSSSTTARPTAPATSPTSSPPPIRGSASGIGPPSRASGRAYLDGFGVALGRRRRRSSSRWTPTVSHDPAALPALIAPDRRRTRRTSSSARATRRGGGVVDWGLGRRVISRGGCLFARIVLGLSAERPDRRLQGVARDDARGGPVRRRPCRRLRVPDRDDVPGEPRRRPDPRDPDHVPRSPRRPVQDVAADRRRGARRRRPAPGSRSCGTPPPCGGRGDRRRP